MEACVIAPRGSADGERHADSLPLVVVTAAGHRAQMQRLPAHVLCEHLPVALESACCKHDSLGMQRERPVIRTYAT